MKNYDAHAALVASAAEMRARRVADARRLAAAVRARRSNNRRDAAARFHAVMLAMLAVAVLAVAVVL